MLYLHMIVVGKENESFEKTPDISIFTAAVKSVSIGGKW